MPVKNTSKSKSDLTSSKARTLEFAYRKSGMLGVRVIARVQNLFNKVGHMIESILHNNRLLGLYCFTLSLSLRLVEKAFLLGSFVLWPVLQQHLEQAGCCLLHHFSPLLSTNTKMQMIVQARMLTLVHWKKTKVRETRQRNRVSSKRQLTKIFVQGFCELVERRRNLEALV